MPRADETVALGLLQGPAELLPVSSSAHVGLLPWVLGWHHGALPGTERKEVEVALHAGTALALLSRERPRLALLAAASAPPALAGLLLERPVEERLGRPPTIAAGLVAGGLAMALADRRPGRRIGAEATVADGAWLGLAQALALVPGVSRSGAVLTAARMRGFGRADAAALARETAVPVLGGAAALKAVRLARRRPPAATLRALAGGALAAAVSTRAARRLERAEIPLAAWAAYRTALAAAILVVWRRRR
jgi:undecaprenyl-diphosphatase